MLKPAAPPRLLIVFCFVLMLLAGHRRVGAGPATECRHLGLLPEGWNDGPACLDSWIAFNQGIWNDLFFQPREFDPLFPAFALQERWGDWKDPSSTVGMNQFGDTFTLVVWYAEPIDWTIAQADATFPAEAFAAFEAAGGAGVIITGVMSESFLSVPVRGCLLSFGGDGGRQADFFVVTERVSWTARGLFPERGDPGGCLCPGCPCEPPLSSTQTDQYCDTYCALRDEAHRKEEEEASKLYWCGMRKYGLGMGGLILDCLVGCLGAPVPAIAGGAVITAATIDELAKCRSDYDAAVEDIFEDFDTRTELECLRACTASGGTPP